MIISDFTKPEIDFLIANCNFTENERKLFLLRCGGYSLDEITDIFLNDKVPLARDTIGRLSQKVNRKIIKVL